MPELDGTTIAAIASFAVLVIAWLVAPTATVTAVTEERELAAAAA